MAIFKGDGMWAGGDQFFAAKRRPALRAARHPSIGKQTDSSRD
jgi:hypothetical protein